MKADDGLLLFCGVRKLGDVHFFFIAKSEDFDKLGIVGIFAVILSKTELINSNSCTQL